MIRWPCFVLLSIQYSGIFCLLMEGLVFEHCRYGDYERKGRKVKGKTFTIYYGSGSTDYIFRCSNVYNN